MTAATTAFPHLAAPFSLRHLSLRNRIVSTAHGTYMCRDGLQTEGIAAYHAARARGGAGLIVLEATSTHPTGIGAPRYAAAHRDDCIPGYARVVEAIHAHGVPVLAQLYHPGRDDIAGSSDDGTLWPAYSSSPVPCERNQLMPRAMSRDLLSEVAASYGAAARRLLAAGVDGIEISAHHGHLIAQFLNPRVNRRNDAYGGNLENRLRFLVDVVEQVRAALGESPILCLRLTCGEGGRDGISTEEAGEVARAMDALPAVDMLHVTSGSSSSFAGGAQVVPDMAFPPGFLEPAFAALRRQVSKPLMATGRINRPEIAERLLAEGIADLCGMTRAQICDPELGKKVATGRAEEIRVCIACNQGCIGKGRRGGAVTCIQYPESGREREFGDPAPASRPRRVLLAGAGPAGLKAAAVAAERGHSVTLYEKAAELGGQVRLAGELPGRAEFAGLIDNLLRETERAGVRLVTGTAVTRALVEREAPDAVVLATGAGPYRPEFAGDGVELLDAWQVLEGARPAGPSVVIADGRLDWVGLGLAELLAGPGRRVRLCALGRAAGETIPPTTAAHFYGAIQKLGVEILPYMRLEGLGPRQVRFTHTVAEFPVVVEDVDSLVLAQGAIQDTTLEDALDGWPGERHVIGDCLAPRTAEEAVLEGLRAGRAVGTG